MLFDQIASNKRRTWILLITFSYSSSLRSRIPLLASLGGVNPS